MITRQDIVDVALGLQGVRFRHQGRDPKTGLDCVGILHYILAQLDQPIFDVEGYRRRPSASVIRATLQKNFDEIPKEDCTLGDFYLSRLIGGVKPCHALLIVSTETDLAKGKQPMVLHTLASGTKGIVTKEPLNKWLPYVVYGYRFRCLLRS